MPRRPYRAGPHEYHRAGVPRLQLPHNIDTWDDTEMMMNFRDPNGFGMGRWNRYIRSVTNRKDFLSHVVFMMTSRFYNVPSRRDYRRGRAFRPEIVDLLSQRLRNYGQDEYSYIQAVLDCWDALERDPETKYIWVRALRPPRVVSREIAQDLARAIRETTPPRRRNWQWGYRGDLEY